MFYVLLNHDRFCQQFSKSANNLLEFFLSDIEGIVFPITNDDDNDAADDADGT